MVGHALQQTETFGFNLHPNGNVSGTAFFQTNGKHIRHPVIAGHFARFAGRMTHHLQEGFMPVTDKDGNPGVMFLNGAYPEKGSDGKPFHESEDYFTGKYKRDRSKIWNKQSHDEIYDTLRTVAARLGISGKVVEGIKANVNSTKHNWQKDDTGLGHYPREMEPGSRDRLASIVNDHLLPELRRRLAADLDTAPYSGPASEATQEASRERITDGNYPREQFQFGAHFAEESKGIPWVRGSADLYRKLHGEKFGLDPEVPPPFYHEIDEEQAKKVADHFDSLEHTPFDEKTARA
jgi:hypothetical protein